LFKGVKRTSKGFPIYVNIQELGLSGPGFNIREYKEGETKITSEFKIMQPNFISLNTRLTELGKHYNNVMNNKQFLDFPNGAIKLEDLLKEDDIKDNDVNDLLNNCNIQ
jgi:hypothetical protein